jgi:hypothetical protein
MLVTGYVARQLSIWRLVASGSIERAGLYIQLTSPAPTGLGKTSQKGIDRAAASCVSTVGAFEIIFCVHTSIIQDLGICVKRGLGIDAKTKPAQGGLAISLNQI